MKKNNRRPPRKPQKPEEKVPKDWKPKTEIGRKVLSGEINKIDQILDNGLKILEPEVVDLLIPELETDLMLIGQSKGKFGGGQRRVFKQTQKKTQEGNKPKFATFAVSGNRNGFVGVGYGKAKETVPAREKAIRNSKLDIIKIVRGNGSWEDTGKEPNTIPFAVEGKCGSVRIKLMPAPRGTRLCVEPECQRILKLAGIKDIWSKTQGQTKSKINLIKACIEALKQLSTMKINPNYKETLGIVEGKIAKVEENVENSDN
jgi:small subunit ribosomal protein S5